MRVTWLRRLARNRNVVVGVAVFLALLLAAPLADVLANHNQLPRHGRIRPRHIYSLVSMPCTA